VRELVWGFVDSSDNQGANDVHGETATTATSISQTTTDWVRESPGENTGPVWDQVTGVSITKPSDVPSDNIISTVSPYMDLVKDVVKVNISESTTFLSEGIYEILTVINEQLSEGTSLTTSSTTKFSTITSPPPTTTTTETDGAITWDYRLLGVDASFDMEDLHWSYFLLMGFACLALLVCLAQAFACLYTSLGRFLLKKYSWFLFNLLFLASFISQFFLNISFQAKRLIKSTEGGFDL